MARRVPLPRLTRRQRLSRLQRERRQRLVYLSTFTTLLFFVFGLVGWSVADKYWTSNLRPAAKVAGVEIPMRDFNRRLTFEQDRFFVFAGVTPDLESDPSVRSQLAGLRSGTLDEIVLGRVFLELAQRDGTVPTAADIEARVARDFGEIHVRHILVSPDPNEKDTTKADADAKAKADNVAKQLQADPLNGALWTELAQKESKDPGSADKGGDLGWVNSYSGFVKEFEDAMYGLSDGQVSDPVKSQYGYHIIQRLETRTATQTPLFARLRQSGLGLDDIRLAARTSFLADLYRKKAEGAEIPSPQEQVRLAIIVLRLPAPNNFQAYADALKKITTVEDGLRAGQDFATLAKEYSDDASTKDAGGEMGWATRSMLPNKDVADDVFSKNVGEHTGQHSIDRSGDLAIYKVLEKDPARAVADDQKSKIKDGAFDLWLADIYAQLGVQKLIPGLGNA